MVSIPPYHPLIIDFTSQVGVAQQQQKRNEEKKVRVENPENPEKVRFEKEKNQEEKKRERRDSQQEESLLPEDKDAINLKQRRVDVIV
jgi:hypothetical protein